MNMWLAVITVAAFVLIIGVILTIIFYLWLHSIIDEDLFEPDNTIQEEDMRDLIEHIYK